MGRDETNLIESLRILRKVVEADSFTQAACELSQSAAASRGLLKIGPDEDL
jgi:DNA-binding transcriptional LysR family regulator